MTMARLWYLPSFKNAIKTNIISTKYLTHLPNLVITIISHLLRVTRYAKYSSVIAYWFILTAAEVCTLHNKNSLSSFIKLS